MRNIVMGIEVRRRCGVGKRKYLVAVLVQSLFLDGFIALQRMWNVTQDKDAGDFQVHLPHVKYLHGYRTYTPSGR